MLNLVIEKIEQLEGVVEITASVIQPSFFAEEGDFDTKEAYSEALAQYHKLTEEFHQLHLGRATLEQTAGG